MTRAAVASRRAEWSLRQGRLHMEDGGSAPRAEFGKGSWWVASLASRQYPVPRSAAGGPWAEWDLRQGAAECDKLRLERDKK